MAAKADTLVTTRMIAERYGLVDQDGKPMAEIRTIARRLVNQNKSGTRTKLFRRGDVERILGPMPDRSLGDV